VRAVAMTNDFSQKNRTIGGPICLFPYLIMVINSEKIRNIRIRIKLNFV